MIRRYMKIIIIALFILIVLSLQTQAQRRIINAVITDQDGNIFDVFKMSGTNTNEGPGLWGAIGKNDIKIPYSKIQSLEFINSEAVGGYPAYEVTFDVVLINGNKMKIRARDHGFRGETEMGPITLSFTNVSKVIFKHRGLKQQCPLCLRIYYDSEWKFCPYDGEKLK